MKRLISTINLSKEEWLRYRKCGITGTDAGAILGLNPYRSAFQVYHDKISDTIENMQLLRSTVFTSVPMNSYYGNYNCSWPPAQVQPATFSYPNMDFSSLIQQDDAQISFQALITP